MKIAIIGSGIARLTSAYLLSRRHDITLFEASDCIGGHTHTANVTVDGKSYAVDTGFIVFNDWTCEFHPLAGANRGQVQTHRDELFGVRPKHRL